MFKLQIPKQLMEAIRSIPDRLVKTPNIPVDEFLQESEDLFRWVQHDKEKIIAAAKKTSTIPKNGSQVRRKG